MYRSIYSILITLFCFVTCAQAEDIICSTPPTSSRTIFDRVGQASEGPTLPNAYALSQIFIDGSMCDDAQPGTIQTISTFFTGPPGFTSPAPMARFNFFELEPGDKDGLPDNLIDNPDSGIDVRVNIVEGPSGMYTVTTADSLDKLIDPKTKLPIPPFQIRQGIRYFVGLTPIIEAGKAMAFESHLANEVTSTLEAAATRMTDPSIPANNTDWSLAAKPDDLLEAAIEIRGITEPDIFLSFSGMGDGGAASNIVQSVASGPLTAYIWVDEEYPLDVGASLDISLSSTGVVEFTAAETFQADITGTTSGLRWEPLAFGATADVFSDFVDGLVAFAVFDGTGILPSQTSGSSSEDSLHDSSSSAFLFGKIDLSVIGSGGDTVTANLSQDELGIVNDGMLVFPTFGAIQINIPASILGDINMDGAVDLLDVGPFVDLLVSGDFAAAGDINGDGCVDLLDVGPFVNLLIGG